MNRQKQNDQNKSVLSTLCKQNAEAETKTTLRPNAALSFRCTTVAAFVLKVWRWKQGKQGKHEASLETLVETVDSWTMGSELPLLLLLHEAPSPGTPFPMQTALNYSSTLLRLNTAWPALILVDSLCADGNAVRETGVQCRPWEELFQRTPIDGIVTTPVSQSVQR